MLQQKLLREKSSIVRLYLIDAFNLQSRDIGSLSDPYFVVNLNDKEVNDSDNYEDDADRIDIHRCLDFKANFPGCDRLRIRIMDKDTIFGDDLIGETYLDLEDRYFSADWNVFTVKPIETRQLTVDYINTS